VIFAILPFAIFNSVVGHKAFPNSFHNSMCDSRKYPYASHGGSRKFLGVWGSKGDKFPKGRGYIKSFSFQRV